MRRRDNLLVAHGVLVMRIDEAAQWLLQRVGDRWYLKFEECARCLIALFQCVGGRVDPRDYR
jgi:hypothetical protein